MPRKARGAPGAFLALKRTGDSWQPPATLPHRQGAGAATSLHLASGLPAQPEIQGLNPQAGESENL